MRPFLILIFLFSFKPSLAADYESAQRLGTGDVISADVMNDILERIELTLKPISADELVGTWDVEQFFCGSESNIYGSASYCNYNDSRTLSSTTLDAGLIRKRSDTVTISSNSNGTINWTASNYDVLFNFNKTDAMQQNTGGLTHTCKVYPSDLMGCLFDDEITDIDGRITQFMKVKRASADQLIFSYGPLSGNGTINILVLNKNSIPPTAPSNLSYSRTSDGPYSLSWTAASGTVSSYSIKYKDEVEDDFSELTTTTSTSYTVTAGYGEERWYRVFAVNDNGTSIGSNVILVDDDDDSSSD